MPLRKPIVLGTDGWHGAIDDEVTDDALRAIARALVRYLRSGSLAGPVAVGYDGRTNSAHYAEIVSEEIVAGGADAILSDRIVPTPVLSSATRAMKCAAGVMITAGNHSPELNGLKFKGPYGGPFTISATKEVEECMASNDTHGHGRRGTLLVVDLLMPYLNRLESLVDMTLLRRAASDPKRQSSVMIDSMGGAGQTIIEDVLVNCGWRAQTIFGAPEHRFYERFPETTEQNLAPLQYNSRVTDAVLGIATDGDGGRCGLVCDDGTWVDAQETLLALLWHLRQQKGWRGRIVKTAAVTDKVGILAEGWKERVSETPVGFEYVAAEMLRGSVLLGADERGGFGWGRYLPERDGICSGLVAVEMIAQSGRSLKEIVDGLRHEIGRPYCSQADAQCPDASAESVLTGLAAGDIRLSFNLKPKSTTVFEERGRINGVKLRFGVCSWLVLRTDRTKSSIRIYAEGRTLEEELSLLESGKQSLDLQR